MGTSAPDRPLKFPEFDNPRCWTAAILENQKSPYLLNHSTDFDKIFWHNNASGPYTPDRPVKFTIFKSQDGGLLPFKNQRIPIIKIS